MSISWTLLIVQKIEKRYFLNTLKVHVLAISKKYIPKVQSRWYKDFEKGFSDLTFKSEKPVSK